MISELLMLPKVFRPKKYSQMLLMAPLHGLVSVLEPLETNKKSFYCSVRCNSICGSRFNEFDYIHLAVLAAVFGRWRVAKSIADLSAVRIFRQALAPLAPLSPFSIDRPYRWREKMEIRWRRYNILVPLSVRQLINRSTLKCVFRHISSPKRN